MAYCVHCGVKLGEAESRCPLCGTEAIDPAAPPVDPAAPKPFPVRTSEQTLTINRKYAVSLLSFLLLLPAAICVFADWLAGGITWSVYPAGVLVLVWIVATVPLLMKKRRTYSTLLITGAALEAYLYMVESLSYTPGWFFPIVMPSVALFVGMICFTVALIRKWKVRPLLVVAASLFQAGVLTLVVEILCVASGVGETLIWSPFVMTPCFFVAALLYLVSKNRSLYEQFRRRLHF